MVEAARPTLLSAVVDSRSGFRCRFFVKGRNHRRIIGRLLSLAFLAVDLGARAAGGRGLRRGSTLAQLLAKKRGARNRMRLPPLKEQQILAWARMHFKATGRWPTRYSGPILPLTGETWAAINQALTTGWRGLPGGSSLPRLLRRHGLK